MGHGWWPVLAASVPGHCVERAYWSEPKPCQKLGSLFDVAGGQSLLMDPCSHVRERQLGLCQAWALTKPTTRAGLQGMEQTLSTGKGSLRDLGSPPSQVLSWQVCLSCRQRRV